MVGYGARRRRRRRRSGSFLCDALLPPLKFAGPVDLNTHCVPCQPAMRSLLGSLGVAVALEQPVEISKGAARLQRRDFELLPPVPPRRFP